MAAARVDAIRLHLLKISAVVRVTARRVWLQLATSHPRQFLFFRIRQQLRS